MFGYINYKIDTESKILYIVYKGTITIDSILQSVEEIISHPNYSVDYDSIVDMQTCHLNINLKELNRISNFLDIDPKLDAYRNSIYLTNKPNEVVITTLYSKLIKNSKVTPHIISTIEAAQSHLSSHIEIDQLKSNLDSLR
ncbi:hypothetical protein [Saccharicrinis aurantiacus]|uniref:hypothetical protein n=1 Tax=Saccharicrinis aurantiacus TaxID=1849719 RepID=UPI000839689A|nr:hypothetical protein [Saccharicrinis aurantiacus]